MRPLRLALCIAIAFGLAMPPAGAAEVAVTLGEGSWVVPGVLTLPDREGPSPAVVLVHGFGPGTIDGDVGPNKIMRETALGLARHGIASLRFAKRTTVHAKTFAAEKRRATIAEEWIDDSVAAARLLKGDARIDPARIYIVGHSASAGLAPKIALLSKAAGAVLVNGSNRPPGALIKDQVDYTATLPGNDNPEASAAHAKMRAAAEGLLADTGADNDIVLGQPMWFWRAMAQTDVAADVRALTTAKGRVLVAHGGRDYLTTETDWRGLQDALASFSGVAMQRFPRLNHMMQEGDGKMTPAEYQWKKPVSEAWIAALAHWVRTGV